MCDFFAEQLAYWRDMKRKHRTDIFMREKISNIIVALLAFKDMNAQADKHIKECYDKRGKNV